MIVQVLSRQFHLIKSKFTSIGFFILYLIAAGLVMWNYVGNSTFNANIRAGYIDMVYMRADKPFVYRLLVPSLIRGTSLLIPDRLEQRFNRRITSGPTVTKIINNLTWERQYFSLYIIGMLYLYGFLIGFMLALRFLFASLFKTSPNFTFIVPLIGLLGFLPWVRWTYLYDFSSLFFFTLGLAFLVRANWTGFLIVYAIGCLNKETMILLTLLFAIYYGFSKKLPKIAFWKLLMYQIIIFSVIKILLFTLFLENGGLPLEFHLLDHNWGVIVDWVKNYSPSTYYLILILVASLFYKWKNQHLFLRSGLWILVALMGLTLLFGWVNEWRDYLEAYPIIILLYMHNLAHWVNVPITHKENQASIT